MELGDGQPLTVEQLTPFDQYHYLGTQGVHEAIIALGLRPGMRVLDIGSGIGGPARYIAAASGAHVTAFELQPDLDSVAPDLTERRGLADLVEHCCGNILDSVGETYDAIVSFLCFLHIEDRKRLLGACRAAMESGGGMYIEDYGKRSRRFLFDRGRSLRRRRHRMTEDPRPLSDPLVDPCSRRSTAPAVVRPVRRLAGPRGSLPRLPSLRAGPSPSA